MQEKSNCPICDGIIEIDSPVMGELVYCKDCSSELEVVSLNPLRLKEAPPEGEDWGQ